MTTITETYRYYGPPAQGLSFSAVVASLHASAQLLREGRNATPQGVAKIAWAEEHVRAGQWLGGQDVGAVVYGGVAEIHTAPDPVFDSVPLLRVHHLVPGWTSLALRILVLRSAPRACVWRRQLNLAHACACCWAAGFRWQVLRSGRVLRDCRPSDGENS